jgi:polysaccharide biosynthesis transport protein
VLGRSITVLPSDLQMSTLEQKLAADYLQLRVQRVGLEQKLKTITRLRTLYRDRADDIPVLSQKQTELEQRYTLAKKTYENLVNRLQDIKVVESQTIGNARVVQKAIAPKVPTGNMRSLLLAGGGVVGLMLGMSAAFLVDLIDRSLKSVKEAQTVYGYALLGLIPRFKPFDPGGVSDLYLNGVSPRVIVATGPRSIIHESYRMLQANLKFTSLDRKVRSIVVTSSVAGVGKSEVAANLAATFAQSGKKVLLIDGDLRAPSQHHLWGVINSIGLSNALVDPEDLPNAFHTVTDRLTILTAGVMPPDPLSLLDSEAMNQLLKACSEQFDYVILDSPPLVGMADAAVLGKIADGVLLVIRPEVETTTTATAAKMLLERSNSRVLGMVANGVNTRQEPDSSFYYSGGAIESYGKVPAYKRLKSKV